MSFFSRIAFRFLSQYGETLSLFFSDLKMDLKKARMKTSSQEYMSIAMLTTFLVFLLEVPLLSYIFGFVFKTFLFSFITAFTVSVAFSTIVFLLFTKYPKTVVGSRSKNIDSSLPFASIYLSTISATKLPLDKVFKIFTRFSKYGEITEEIRQINNDVEMFGLDINTALERAVERSPSKNFKELLWGILSISTSGGDVAIYLREKAKSLMEDYRRQLTEFSKKVMLFTEIYLTAIILGAIFFIILISIFSGISSGLAGNSIIIQSLIIFLFLPLVSLFFLILVKTSTPGGE